VPSRLRSIGPSTGESEASTKVERKRRGRYEIVADILKCCTDEEAGKFDIACYTKVYNYPALNKYLARLIEKGLLVKKDGKYRTTEKGIEAEKLIRKVLKTLGWEHNICGRGNRQKAPSR